MNAHRKGSAMAAAVSMFLMVGCFTPGTDPDVAPDPAAGGQKHVLSGSAWRLEDLSGAPILEGVEVTLEFLEGAKVGGRSSCNHFFGVVEISGDLIRFDSIGGTRMACGEAIMDQETEYLSALERAHRFTVRDSMLLIYSGGRQEPLRFARQEPRQPL
jgi:heat shock protein HslJ